MNVGPRAFDAQRARSRENALFVILSVVVLAIVFAGFAPTYYLRSTSVHPPLVPLLHLHGALFTTWVLLFSAQIWLVTGRRVGLHRRLGVFGAVLAGSMVVVGLAAIGMAARRDLKLAGGTGPLAFMAIAIGDILLFATFVALGFVFRKRPDVHKRLMLLATISLLPAAFSRLPLISGAAEVGFFLATDFMLLGCLIADRRIRGRAHAVFVYGIIIYVLSQPARVLLGMTEPWQTFARWLISR